MATRCFRSPTPPHIVRSWMFAVVLVAALAAPARAQTQDHDVRIRIPNYIGIKIVDGSGTITNAASVVFDYGSDPAGYVAAYQGSGSLAPTSVLRFADVQVIASRGRWYVYTRATPISYAGTGTGAGLGLADIRVRRGAVSGLAAGAGTVAATWTFGTGYRLIARGRGGTFGWQSLGFNGRDYEVAVQGDEDPGEYFTQVTYLLYNP